MTTVKVITFNILSPFLCNDTEFIGYKPEYLDRNARKQKIFNMLKDMIRDNPIICLQEIAFNWKGEIERFFFENNYKFFSINYGYKKNGYFSIGTAVPNNIKICKTEYILIGDYINSNSPERIFNWEEQQREIERKVKRESAENIFDNLLTYVEEYIFSKEDSIKEIENTIQEAKNRQNFSIKLTLQEISKIGDEDAFGKKFIIYNYHMPCTFKKPIIQSMHIDSFKALMYEHNQIPTIWAGDFNFKPDTNEYDYLTKGQLDNTHRIYIPQKLHSTFNLKSAIHQIKGNEPKFTCFSNTKFGGEFKGTLDYIMISNNIKVIDGDVIVHSATKLPNEICGSDHLPIFAILEL